MDQLKEILGVLRRQHFWFIAPLLLAIGLVGWVMANKKLTSEFDTNSQAVKSYIDQMTAVSSRNPHPNTDYETGMAQLIAERRENVRAAWTRKWEQQKQELGWPEGLDTRVIAQFEPLRPIEKQGGKGEVHSQHRQAYADFISKQLPMLAESIGARWQPSGGGRSSTGFAERFRAAPRAPQSRASSQRAGAEEQSSMVHWDPENQADIEARFNWGAQGPTTLQVLYAQEDLWVLSTLIEIIQRTNGDAKIRSLAPIKDIEFIKIAQDVNPPSQQGFRVVRPVAAAGGDETGDAPAAAPAAADAPVDYGTVDRQAGGEEVPLETSDASGAPNPLLELVKNRYYDMQYQPITDLESPSLKVAKRIPVRLRVRMDQRKITDLLVECANANLTFEVRQLRFNPQGSAPGGSAERLAGAASLLRSGGDSSKRLDPNDYPSLDRTVELFGIVYIFNPVDDAVLSGEVPTDEPPLEDAAGLPADQRRGAQLALAR